MKSPADITETETGLVIESLYLITTGGMGKQDHRLELRKTLHHSDKLDLSFCGSSGIGQNQTFPVTYFNLIDPRENIKTCSKLLVSFGLRSHSAS